MMANKYRNDRYTSDKIFCYNVFQIEEGFFMLDYDRYVDQLNLGTHICDDIALKSKCIK